MLERLGVEWFAWWVALTPEFRFLFLLPFIVALGAFLGSQVRRLLRAG